MNKGTVECLGTENENETKYDDDSLLSHQLRQQQHDLRITVSCLNHVIRRISEGTQSVSSLSMRASSSSSFTDAIDIPSKNNTAVRNFWCRRNSQNNRTQQDLPEIVHMYSPYGLEQQFQQLYCLLHPCLVQHDNDTNAAAFVQGYRGMGKNLLVQRCLQAFKDEIRYQQQQEEQKTKKSSFRIVHVNGIMTPGEDVSLVIKEILKQLSMLALREAEVEMENRRQMKKRRQRESNKNNMEKNNEMKENIAIGENYENGTMNNCNDKENVLEKNNGTSNSSDPYYANNESENENDSENEELKATKRRKKIDNHLLRLREKSSFTSNLQLLTETLEFARVDNIPILIILDEVDAFVGGGGVRAGSAGGGTNNNTMDAVIGASNGTSNNNNSAGGTSPQLLLYHLLDRVATQGSSLCLIGITSHLGFKSMLEKRIRSRMEGTSKEILVRPCPNFESLSSLFLEKFYTSKKSYNNSKDNRNITNNNNEKQQTQQQQQQKYQNDVEKDEDTIMALLQSQVSELLTEPLSEENLQNTRKTGSTSHVGVADRTAQKIVWEALERDYRLGKDIRWFSRVFFYALSLFRTECQCYLQQIEQEYRQYQQQQQQNATTDNSKIDNGIISSKTLTKKVKDPPKFQPRHLMEALISMGGSFLNENGQRGVVVIRKNNDFRGDIGNPSTADADNTGGSTGNTTAVAVDPRMQTLMDLSGPQVAIILSARRILARDCLRTDSIAPPFPLTFDRIVLEYQRFFRFSSSVGRKTNSLHQRQQRNSNSTSTVVGAGAGAGTYTYSTHLLFASFKDLLDMNIIRPAIDHVGTGPFQYEHRNLCNSNSNTMDPTTMGKVPLHLLVDIHRELNQALEQNLLECSTAFREWARNTN